MSQFNIVYSVPPSIPGNIHIIDLANPFVAPMDSNLSQALVIHKWQGLLFEVGSDINRTNLEKKEKEEEAEICPYCGLDLRSCCICDSGRLKK